MAEVRVEVWFEGRTTIAVDPSQYPQYFKDNEARGGIARLLEDTFYDEADFRSGPFVEGATEIFRASLGVPEEVS